MKLDLKKPHGVITGHSWARYEQDGILYDQMGYTEDYFYNNEEEAKEAKPNFKEEEKVVLPEPVVERDFALEQARDFLVNILAGGPIARSVIFKEANANNQNWDKVKTAFADMQGEAFHKKNVIHWKLKAE
jgi:hypothetical protein